MPPRAIRRLLPLVLLALPAVASAEPPAPAPLPAPAPAKKPSTMDMLRARKLAEDAGKLAKKKDWAGALAKLREADALEPRPQVRLAIARAQKELGQLPEAYATVDALLATSAKKLSGPDLAEAKKLRDELAKKTGLLEVRASEPGAEVKVDGAPAGTTPLAEPLRRAAGAHEVALAKPGFDPFTANVELAGGEQRVVDAKLEPEVKTGHVAVREKAGAEVHVLVDQSDMGLAPWEGELPPGPHTIVLQSDALRAREQRIDVAARHRYDLTLEAAPRAGKVRVTAQPATAQIAIDGNAVGQGSYAGELPVGEHALEVSAAGYQTRSGKVQIKADEEAAIDLPLSAVAAAEVTDHAADYRGVYVGLDFFGGRPASAITYACPDPNAGCSSSSQPPFPVGAGAALRVGYSFGVIGVEVAGAGLGQLQHEVNTYDGTGSATPGGGGVVDASVARDEDFKLLSAGFFGGVGLRATTHGKVARLTVGAAGGVAFHSLRFSREVSGDVNDSYTSTVSYAAPGLLADAALLLGWTPGFKVKLGVMALVDAPGGDKSTADQNPYTVSSDSGPDRLLDTPPFVVAKSPSVFFGPTLGFQIGR